MKHIVDRQPSWVIQTVFGYVISKLLVYSLKLRKMAQIAEIRLGTPTPHPLYVLKISQCLLSTLIDPLQLVPVVLSRKHGLLNSE